MEESGTQMVAKLGVQPGHTVVDFGCGVGRYSIPLSKAVGEKGTVYAIEHNNEHRIKEVFAGIPPSTLDLRCWMLMAWERNLEKK